LGFQHLAVQQCRSSFGKKNFLYINDVIIAVVAAGLFLAQIHPAIEKLMGSATIKK